MANIKTAQMFEEDGRSNGRSGRFKQRIKQNL